MKKTLTILVLSLCIVASLVSGSLAIYQASVDDIDTATVVAKKFYLDAYGSGDDYAAAVDIAPGEVVSKAVAVVNYDGENIENPGNITEVPMKLNVTVNIGAAAGKTAIPMLQTRVYKVTGNGNRELVAESNVGVDTLTFEDATAFEANVANTITYEIEVTWPENNGIFDDIDYQGDAFGNAINVEVTGTQIN